MTVGIREIATGAQAKINLLQEHGGLHIVNGWEVLGLKPHKEARSGNFYFSQHNPVWAYINPKFANPYSVNANNKPLFEIITAVNNIEELKKNNILS